MPTPPNLFVSYSWSSRAHEQWVLELAERLTQDGVHVVIDKWDLREGHDAHAFMEQMVTNSDITKVAIIFDKQYARKADERERGVGTETRLITSEIYQKSSQDKFVAVIAEKDSDDNPYIPAYYRGRIYIDLANASRVEEEYDRLLRWIFDKPLYSRPPIGKAPSFLDKKPAQRFGNTSDLKRVLDQLKDGKAVASATLDDYLTSVTVDLESLRIKKDFDIEFDQQVVDSIDSFLPTRDDIINVFQVVARYMPTEENVEKIPRFFEKILPYFCPPENVNSYSDFDFDGFKFIAEELYLYCIAIFLDAERFKQASFLMDTELYFPENRRFGGEPMVSVVALNSHIKSLSYRNERLKLSRASLHADLLHDRNKRSSIPFAALAQADIVLFLNRFGRNHSWWPTTSVYLTGGRATLPLFARARSKKFFAKMRPILNDDDVDRFKARINSIDESDAAPRWNYFRLRLATLVGIEGLGTAD